MKAILISAISFFIVISSIYSQETKKIKLPQPQTDIGKPLMQTLKLRQSSREFNSKPLPLQEISNLLWAANGINRTESGKLTAPSAMNNQETDIYVAMQSGVYIFNVKENCLDLVVNEDIRGLTGKQEFVKTAPVNLVYVSDFSKMGKANNEDKILYSAADVGFIAENVYLYCASQGLSVVVRGSIDRGILAKKLNLKAEQKIILSQTIGFPKD